MSHVTTRVAQCRKGQLVSAISGSVISGSVTSGFGRFGYRSSQRPLEHHPFN